ncbi:COX15/CtaA family protein [Haladaptatus sp. DJG-WS-42]|uniref:COX15/CtaA family protein n=1 Tax=Haladaptatus sp. DJG-WS-42 TaxID=3120516 RepID=UPI0030D23D25
MNLRYRHLAAVTAGLTYILILLGVYTSLMGAGASCNLEWPLCSGGFLPQTAAGWIEWTHRLVAMITGFFILGTTYGAWKHDRDPRLKKATAIAAVFLPTQILLGAVTVKGYIWFGSIQHLVVLAHHATAMIIFAATVATTAWAYSAAQRETATSLSHSSTPADD